MLRGLKGSKANLTINLTGLLVLVSSRCLASGVDETETGMSGIDIYSTVVAIILLLIVFNKEIGWVIKAIIFIVVEIIELFNYMDRSPSLFKSYLKNASNSGSEKAENESKADNRSIEELNAGWIKDLSTSRVNRMTLQVFMGGLRALQRKDASRALSQFTRVLGLRPDDPCVLLNRAKAWTISAHWEQAREDYDSALALVPECVIAYLGRANAHLKQDHIDLALADCEKAIQLHPKNPEAYSLKAQLHLARSEWDKARADLDQAIALDRSKAIYFLDRARTYARSNLPYEAIRDIRRAVHRDPLKFFELEVEPDFDTLHNHPDFISLVKESRQGARVS